MPKQRFVSLFSGIGGFERGLSESGFEPILLCENDPLARCILETHYPGVPIRKDILNMRSLPDCELLVAGWPCQDLSQAGRTTGITGGRSGLVNELFRLLDNSRKKPRTILLENVAFALHLKGGQAIWYVVRELEKRGYSWSYRILDTVEFGLPQRRRRIFILATLDAGAAITLLTNANSAEEADEPATHIGFYWTEGNRGIGWTYNAVPPLKGGSGFSIPSPPAVWDVASSAFYTPTLEDAEQLQGFPAGWTLPVCETLAHDRARWRLIGNAVSVPVVSWIGSMLGKEEATLEEAENLETKRCKNGSNAAYGGPGLETTLLKLPEGPNSPHRATLAEFRLSQGQPLSLRAAKGFLGRYVRSSLRKRDDFVADLTKYCSMEQDPVTKRRDRAA